MQIKCTCGKSLRVPVTAAGKTGQCPSCGEKFRIPKDQVLTAELVQQGESLKPPLPMMDFPDLKEPYSTIRSNAGDTRTSTEEANPKTKTLLNPQLAKRRAFLDRVRVAPLMDYQVCRTCGWFGINPSVSKLNLETVVGVSAAAGGAVLGSAGAAGSLLGMVLTLIGLPLLCAFGIILILIGILFIPLFGIGLIPIALGVILLFFGVGIATTGTIVGTSGVIAAATGATVGTSGALVASRGRDAQKAAATAPRHCPMCNHPALIPATSPLGLRLIHDDTKIFALAESERSRILQWVDNEELNVSREELRQPREQLELLQLVPKTAFGMTAKIVAVAVAVAVIAVTVLVIRSF